MKDVCQSMLNAMNAVVWETTSGSSHLKYISDNAFELFGYKPSEWIKEDSFWLEHTCSDDRERMAAFFSEPELWQNRALECKLITAQGSIAWTLNYVSLQDDEHGHPTIVRGVMIDVTKEKMEAHLMQLENQVLELNANPEVTVTEVLAAHIIGLEKIFQKIRCSILRIVDNRIYNWVSPSLPAEYINHIEGLQIGPNRGSCGTAAYYGEKVIVADIENDPRWIEFKDIALSHDLRACWSIPVKSETGAVIATLALYYDEVRTPSEVELSGIERAGSILRIITLNKDYARTVDELHNMAQRGESLANFGTWQFDFETKRATWSETLCRIFGVDPEFFFPSLDTYLDMVHPEDRPRIAKLLTRAQEEGSEVNFEERIIRRDGSVRNLRSWFKAVKDKEGKPLRYFGASMDITREKSTERRMEAIAWLQSHVVRAPLARIMGLVSLLELEHEADKDQQQFLLKGIVDSANELDDVIRQITYNTRPDV